MNNVYQLDLKVEDEVRNEVINLCSSFPIYKNLNK